MDNPHFRTSLVSLGHISLNLPEQFPVIIKNIVSRKVVKDLLMKDQTETTLQDDVWVEEEDLPPETRCKVKITFLKLALVPIITGSASTPLVYFTGGTQLFLF